MDVDFARELIALNNRFYAQNAVSFSATRSGAWEGWEQVLSVAEKAGLLATANPLRVLDAACGNMRFLRFLRERLPSTQLAYLGIDACDDLAGGANTADAASGTASASYWHVNILDELLAGTDPFDGVPAADLTACFGFMHHVPGTALRQKLIAALAEHTAPGGIIAISFWRFMGDARLAAKALTAEQKASAALPFPGYRKGLLEPGDHLLGWQDSVGSFRYCHHADEDEIDELVAHVAPRARELARFSADGKTHTLNRYVVLQRL